VIAEAEYGAPFADGDVTATRCSRRTRRISNRCGRSGRVADVKTMAHITGGGLLENVPRTLPDHAAAVFEQTRWDVPAVMSEIVRRAGLAHDERYRTLNMGVGYTLIVPIADVDAALSAAPGARSSASCSRDATKSRRVVVRPARTAL